MSQRRLQVGMWNQWTEESWESAYYSDDGRDTYINS